MKENRITITIKKPIHEVFEFTLNPKNTPLWIKDIIEEKTDSETVTQGTRYTNEDRDGRVASYTLTVFQPYKVFEMNSDDLKYNVRYTFRELSETEVELDYYEWVTRGELKYPFELSTLENLKKILES